MKNGKEREGSREISDRERIQIERLENARKTTRGEGK